MTDPCTPVLVGIAQVKYRISHLDEAVEPVKMMLEACRRAQEDTTAGDLLKRVQSVRVIRGRWNYANPARYIAESIGASGAETTGTLFGGNQVQSVVNHTAASILAGDLDLVLITGAENGYSSAKARKAGVTLPQRDTPGEYDQVFGNQKPEHHEHEIAKGIRTAIQVYPMYDNALRYHRGETIEQHLVRVSELWSRFNDVAIGNPHAWIRDDISAEEIRTPSPANRAVSFPYTKLMNANMMVDMAAALIMCSVEKARQLQIPEHLWVYPLAGVEGYDHFSASVRNNFHSSPGIGVVGRRVMEIAGTDIGELSYVDLYSCFPSAVQIAAAELGLAENRQLTVTGGLTFGGGPLNNYVMHSIARMAELLRENPEKKGLITANGGNLYKHAHCVYSGTPPGEDFRCDNVQAEIDRLPSRECLAAYQGDVIIESYTVMYADGKPSVGHFSCLTPVGQRTWINTQDQSLMQSMVREEFCGRQGHINDSGLLAIKS